MTGLKPRSMRSCPPSFSSASVRSLESPSRIFQKSQTHADTLILSDFIFKNQSHFIITALDPENSAMSYLSQYPKKWSQCLSPEGLSVHTY